MDWSDFKHDKPQTTYDPNISYSSVLKKTENKTQYDSFGESATNGREPNSIGELTQKLQNIKLKKIPVQEFEKINTIPQKKPTTITTNKKNVKRSNYCYTCKPRGKVLKHIIEKSATKNVLFHFDLHKRPIILVTPTTHYKTIYEIPTDEIATLFQSIKQFCDEWNIVDYQLSFNNGQWQSHTHFHIKIKSNEKLINRLKKDHFKMHKLKENYE